MKPRFDLFAGRSLLGWAGVLAFLLLVTEALAQTRTWNIDADGSWSTDSNWSPYFSTAINSLDPNGQSYAAVLGGIITANRTITLDVAASLGTLTISDDNNYLLSGANTLSFNNGAASAVLNISGAGSPTISVPIVLSSDLTINATGPGTTTLSGIISGAHNLTLNGTGTAVLSGADTLSGIGTINGGTLSLSGANGAANAVTAWIVGYGGGIGSSATLQLDNSGAGNTLRIGNANGITLKGGTFQYLINTASGSYSETIGALTISSGGATLNSGQAASGQTSALTFASLAHSAGGTVNFAGTGLGTTRNAVNFTTAPTLANGILGGWATVGSDWATNSASGIAAYAGYSAAAQGSWGATLNVKPASTQTLGNNRTVNSVDLAGGVGITLNNRTLTIGSGGILTSGGTSVIAGSGSLVAGTTDAQVYAQIVSGATLRITNAVIANNGGTAIGLTKSGGGTLVLNSTNTYTGPTIVNGGTLLLLNRQDLSANTLTINGGEIDVNYADATAASLTNITINNGTIRDISTGASQAVFLTSAASSTLNINGPAQIISQGNTATAFLEIDGVLNVNNLGVLTLNASNANDKIVLGGSQKININAGGTLATTGSGTVQLSSASARTITGSGTSSSDATLRLRAATTSYNAGTAIAVNGSGTGGLRLEGGDTDLLTNLLTSARVGALTGTGGTLTIASTSENNTNNIFLREPTAANSTVKIGFDVAAGQTNWAITFGQSADDVTNWAGIVVKGGNVAMGATENFTSGGSAQTLDMLGGTLYLAGLSPTGTRTLALGGDARLSGGVIDFGPGGSATGTLKVGGNIYSDGTVLTGSPTIVMNPGSGASVILGGSVPLGGGTGSKITSFTKDGLGTVTVNQVVDASLGTVELKQGTLLLGADQVIKTLNTKFDAGTTFGTQGHSQYVGSLTLSGQSTLDLGSAASNAQFSFKVNDFTSGTLVINNWSDGIDQVLSSNITTAQLTSITFANPYGGGGTNTAELVGNEIRPHKVPEPATIGLSVLLLAALGYRERPLIRRALSSLSDGFCR